MTDKRLMTIESKLAYQESTILDLNDVIFDQQQQIDKLETICRELLLRLSDVAESLDVAKSGQDEIPPHY